MPSQANVGASAATGRAALPLLHPRLQEALQRVAACDLSEVCRAPAPPYLRRGVDEFNAGQYFEQHETLELLWRATPGEIRYFYQGILQIGVGLLHLFERRNYHGALAKLDSGERLLAAFPPTCQGIDAGRLRRETRALLRQVEDLGPARLQEIPRAAAPQVHWIGKP